jgi:hypothetical protein
MPVTMAHGQNDGTKVRDHRMGGYVDVHAGDLTRQAAKVVVIKQRRGANLLYIWRHGTGARLSRGECLHLYSRMANDPMLRMSSLVTHYPPGNGH